jgi:anaerobic selenocysteine-containing dehydrogenase
MVGAGVGAGAAALGLGLYHLRRRADAPELPVIPPSVTTTPVEIIRYGDFTDLYRERWTWDRVAKGTHTRANCIAACSWDVFVKDGIAWREEQNAVYEPPRPDVPDGNPRGCQKGACYTDLQLASSRVLHPLKRVGPRGSGKWQRISWERALDEVADKLIDAAIDQGTESIIYDHGTTNAGYGPETAGEIRFAESVGATCRPGACTTAREPPTTGSAPTTSSCGWGTRPTRASPRSTSCTRRAIGAPSSW